MSKLRILTVVFLWATFALGLGAADVGNQPQFNPPNLLTASKIPFPDNGTAGMLGLWVNLDGSANVKYVQVRRALPSLTGNSLVALDNWTFAPARIDQESGPANLPVDIVFDPSELVPRAIPLPPREAESQPLAPARYVPPEVLKAWYAAYPEHSNAYGTLVLDVSLNKSGRVKDVSVIRSRSASLDKPAVAAVKRWEFKPGMLDGMPVNSNLVVAFVFRLPVYPSA